MLFYGAYEIMELLGVSRSKAYEIIRELSHDLKKIGKLNPKAGKIQAKYFCERFMLTQEQCDNILKSKKGGLANV